jgi:hypothetical protein
MSKKNKIIIISGLVLIFLAVFYFYNFLYLKEETALDNGSQSLPVKKVEAQKLDLPFFSSPKLTELREVPLELVPVSELEKGNKNLFRSKQD